MATRHLGISMFRTRRKRDTPPALNWPHTPGSGIRLDLTVASLTLAHSLDNASANGPGLSVQGKRQSAFPHLRVPPYRANGGSGPVTPRTPVRRSDTSESSTPH